MIGSKRKRDSIATLHNMNYCVIDMFSVLNKLKQKADLPTLLLLTESFHFLTQAFTIQCMQLVERERLTRCITFLNSKFWSFCEKIIFYPYYQLLWTWDTYDFILCSMYQVVLVFFFKFTATIVDRVYFACFYHFQLYLRHSLESWYLL